MKSFTVILLALAAATASAAPVGIASGQETGTNWPMVENIRQQCSTPTSPISNGKTNGSMDNIFSVYGVKTTQYGVSQEDALVYQKGVDPKMMENIVMVFPFFSTEVHLVVAANSPIRSLADLQGKRVIEGPDGSGTWVTTQVIKGLTRMSWQGSFQGQADGLSAVQAGQADAMFINAGAPIIMLQRAQGIRLVSITHPALDQFKYYTRTMLPGNLYPNLGGQSVSTYKVNNGLITYNYKAQYQTEIAQLVTCITKNLPGFQSGDIPGSHPKWRSVDPLAIDTIQWPVHPAAMRALKAAALPTSKK